MLKKISPLFILLTLFYNQSSVAKKPPSIFVAKQLVFSKDKSQLIYVSSINNPQKADLIKVSTNNGKVLKTASIKQISLLKPFAATPDGFKILANTQRGIAVIHNGTGKVLRTLPYPTPANKKGSSYIQSHDGVLLAIPNKRKIDIIHTGSGKNLYIIDIKNIFRKKTPNPIVRAMGFSPKRRYFAYVTQSNQLRKSILTVYDFYKKTNTTQVDLANNFYDTRRIHFSRNGKNLIINFSNKRGLSLIHVHNQTIKNLRTDYFSLSGFTPNDSKIITVHPYSNHINLYSINTGKNQKLAISLKNKAGSFGLEAIQSADKSLLALPLKTRNFAKINQFLIINASTGKLLRRLEFVK